MRAKDSKLNTNHFLCTLPAIETQSVVEALALYVFPVLWIILFNPHGYLAEGQYILPIFYFIFLNGRLSRMGISKSNGLIFTKISGFVDEWKGLLTWYTTL